MMHTMLILTSAVLATGCSGRPAPQEPAHVPDVQFVCANTAYDGFTHRAPTSIPDADPAGSRIGPLHVPAGGGLIGQLLVSIDLSHDYVGDLEIRLLYDENGDGEAEADVTLEIYRARQDACDGAELSAYPVVLDGRYYFRGDADTMSISQVSLLAPFADLERGGDFYLLVTDSAAGDTGVVHDWTVFLKADHRPPLARAFGG